MIKWKGVLKKEGSMFGGIKKIAYFCNVIQLSIYLTGTEETIKRSYRGMSYTT